VYLNKDAFKSGRHSDGADFDDEIAGLKTRSTRLDLDLLGSRVKMVEFEHEQVEQVVGHQSHRLVAVGRLEQGEDRRGVLGVVQYVDGSRWSCSEDNKTTND